MSSPQSKSPAIAVRGLTKYYGKRPVVHALDLEIPVGSVYGMLGRNGAGKSTLLKMLTGLIQPDAGAAELLGQPVASMAPATWQRIAYIAEGHSLYRNMTIDALERFVSVYYPHWNAELFGRIISHFSLPRKKRVRGFSNGQRAQVSLALAVAPQPELLILDDPTLGLDTVVRRDFLESMIQIIQQEGRTILFSSHVLGDVERVADRIGIIVNGVLRVDCSTDHFKDSLRKIVLRFRGSPPAYLVTEGIVSDRVDGDRRELVIANYSDAHRAADEELNPLEIDVLELNLEDAFIEYTRDTRGGLPVFEHRPPPTEAVAAADKRAS